jgi:hypothetical protein
MQEIAERMDKYDAAYIREHLEDPSKLNAFATAFFQDVVDVYDAITRIKNIDRNPQGFDLDDAPILGLLIRVWKLLKEIVRYYGENNGEVISVLERPVIEGSVMASYLMMSSNEVVEDYRKCSYKDRLRILKMLEEGSPFLETKAGKRLLRSVREKLSNENLMPNDFALQKKNRWKVQGKSFHDIFSAVEHADLYACTYGMMSESIHGSWNESMDFCLHRHDENIFSCYPFYQEADIRFLSPTLRFTNRPYRMWLHRIDVKDEYLDSILEFIERLNEQIFRRFDAQYDA